MLEKKIHPYSLIIAIEIYNKNINEGQINNL